MTDLYNYDPTGQSQQAAQVRQQYSSPTASDPGNPNAPVDINPQAPSAVPTDQYGNQTITVVVNGRAIEITLNQQVKPDQPVRSNRTGGSTAKAGRDLTPDENFKSIQGEINTIQDWYQNNTTRAAVIKQMYDAGLLTSNKNPSAEQVTMAWALVVQEAAIEGDKTPQELLARAAEKGWSAMSPTLSASDGNLNGSGEFQNSSSSASQTIYQSYLDPATVMGALADSYFRLVGRNPTQNEYKAFLDQVYNYQSQENTGRFETKGKIPASDMQTDATGAPIPADQQGSISQTNIVSQRGIGTRGLEFLAGQQAINDPEEAPYQAATTYFNAFVKALSGPAAGMQASGPTNTAP